MQARSERPASNNGAARAPSLAAVGGAAFYDDPMSKVLGLDSKTRTVAAWFGFTSGSTLLLVAIMALTSVVAWIHTMRERVAASAPEEIEVMKEDTPPPPPPAQAEPEAKAEQAPPPPPRAREAPPPPPTPAQAAKVLAQEPDPNEPVDLTGNTIVQGNGDAYAGGFTSGNGTNANAVRSAPSPTGVAGGTGPLRAAPPMGPDRSRSASVGGSDWNCPFPPEADADQIDDTYVTLQADVRADGTPAAVHLVADPGSGFGREAVRCAASKRFLPALDHDGNPIAAPTKPFRVHFQR
jgi:periplasmic protein TonB